jgi:O-antigen/teichoic acid export membrane protein
VTAIAAPARVVANMFAKGAAFLVEKAAQIVMASIAAHCLGAAGFGRYAFAANLAVLFAFGSDLGLTTWTTRALARSPETSPPVLGTGLRLRLAASGIVMLALGVVALFVDDRGLAVAVLALGVAALTRGLCDHARAVFRAHERLGDEGRLNVAVGVLGMGGGIAGLIAGAGGIAGLIAGRGTIAPLALGIMAGTFGGALYGFLLLGRNYGPWAGPADGVLARRMLREAAPFWLAGAFTLMYSRADVLLLKWLSTDAEVGAYRAAAQVMEGAKQLPMLLMTATFPQLARAFRESRQALLRVERSLAGMLLAGGLLVGGSVAVAADPIVPLMFGSGFGRTVPALRLLAIALPIQFVNCGLLHFFIARDRGVLNMAFAAGMVVVSATANALLDGPLGATGAAISTVVMESSLLVCCLYALRILRREDRG